MTEEMNKVTYPVAFHLSLHHHSIHMYLCSLLIILIFNNNAIYSQKKIMRSTWFALKSLFVLQMFYYMLFYYVNYLIIK